MRKQALLATAVVCCLATPAWATTTVILGDYWLSLNTPGQVVQVLISSDIPQGIQSVDLGLEVQDGGPFMTAIDMESSGTVFGDAPTGNIGQTETEAFPTRNQLMTIATNPGGDTSPAAGGVLALITFDATGSLPGVYGFNLIYEPFQLPTATSSIPQQDTVLVNGTLILDPEPSSIVLGLLAAAGAAVVAIRRRRSGKAA